MHMDDSAAATLVRRKQNTAVAAAMIDILQWVEEIWNAW
jgi:hypothetical protein